MTTMVRLQEVPFIDETWMPTLMAHDCRPNVLVQRSDASIVAAAVEMGGLCAQPFRVCMLPGRLYLPEHDDGPVATLLIGDVSTLTLRQQVELSDWIQNQYGDLQIISLSSVPLWPLVTQGRFLEGLFYRLNVVQLVAE